MRNFLILIVSLLAPYALYASGCNQNPQASFPTTPEMRALARAPEQAGRAPFIPAPAIDREILASAHDAATKSRVQAVQDRSNVYAMAAPAAGLFVLPTEQSAAPMPSAREFWSRPVAAAPQQQYQSQAQPRYASAPDVYAMAPAGQPFPEAVPVLPALGFEPLPEPITIGPAVPTAGFYSQSPLPQQFPVQRSAQPVPPVPAFLPAPRPPAGPAMQSRPAIPSVPVTPYPLRPGEKLLPPETVPGLFLGADAAGAATARQPLAVAGPGREVAVRSAPSAPPPLLSLAPPGLPPPSSRAQSSAPQHRASRRLEALLQNTDAALVLAPLPSLSGKTNFAGETVAAIHPAPAVPVFPAAKVPAMSAAPVQPLPLALPPAGLIPTPPAAAPVAPATPAADLHDFFRTDFWAAKPQSAVVPAPALRPEPANEPPALPTAPNSAAAPALPPFPLPAATPPAAKPAAAATPVAVPSLPSESGLKPPEDFARDWDMALPAVKAESEPAGPEAPARVTLKPIRRKQELQAIDAEIDVAPMNF